MDPPQQQLDAEERVPRGADDEDGGMTPVDSRSGPDLQTTTSSGELHPDEETSACDDDISVADTDLSSVALDEDAQSSMTVTGATASHLKRELLSAMEGKRTIRRLSMAHAADCEESDDELEYATISGARGHQMREELSFAVSHPTHGEVHLRRDASSSPGPLLDDEGMRQEELRAKEQKAMDRSNSIQSLLALANHSSAASKPANDREGEAHHIDIDIQMTVGHTGAEGGQSGAGAGPGPKRVTEGSVRRRTLRRHNTAVGFAASPSFMGFAPPSSLTGPIDGAHHFEMRAHMHKCFEAAEAMDLISKAVTVGNQALGVQLQKHVDVLSSNLQRMDNLETASSGTAPLKQARRMARHINAEVVKARRSKWNQMLGYSEQAGVDLGSPVGSPLRRVSTHRSPVRRLDDAGNGSRDDGRALLPERAAKPVSTRGDGTQRRLAVDVEAPSASASPRCVTDTGSPSAALSVDVDHSASADGKMKKGNGPKRPRLTSLCSFLRTNLFASTAPALLICLLYSIVILVLSIHEEKHYATQHVHAVPYTHYLAPDPLRVVEVEVKFGAAPDSHRRHRATRRGRMLQMRQMLAASAPSVGMPPLQYVLSLEQLQHQVWLPLRLQNLEVYEADEIAHHLTLRPEDEPGRIGGAPLRVVLSSSTPGQVAYVQVLQQGWIGDAQRWIALTILVFVLLLIAVEVVNRVLVAMFGSFLMLLLLVMVGRPPTLPGVIEWVDEGTLGLLFGMMIMVGKLSATGFFELATLRMVGMSRGRCWYLFVVLCLLTAALSAFLDNVTTVLLIAPATLELCKKLEVDPTPYLIGEILFSNIGGAATMIGDPPNVIVGNALSSELTFTDFLAVLAPGVVLIAPFAIGLLRYTFRSSVTGKLRRMDLVTELRNEVGIADKPLFYKSAIVLGVTVLLFLLHPVHHTDPAWIALLGAGTLMLVGSPHDIHHDLEYVEWDTLIFFASLFVMVEAMGEVGLIRGIGDILTDVIKSVPESRRLPAAISILMWSSALISGFLDNIPYTATMVPIIQQLANAGLGLELKPLAFALCFGACLGGNGSLVGASANIVVAGIADRMGHTISFNSFIRVSFPVMLLSVAIANGYALRLWGYPT